MSEEQRLGGHPKSAIIYSLIQEVHSDEQLC